MIAELEDLFLPEIYFCDLEDAFLGALAPIQKDPITFNKRKITPIIPINPILLDYFTSEDLIKAIQFETIEGQRIKIILKLPLSGITENTSPQIYTVCREYQLKEELVLHNQLPVLQIWPNFRANGWKEYYAFYYDGALGDRTFQVRFPTIKYLHDFKAEGEKYQIANLESFPEYIQCLDNRDTHIGSILLKSPELISPSKTWQVGIDFKIDYTNIYVNCNDNLQPLSLDDLQVQVTKTGAETRVNTLFEYFIPENFIPSDNPLPIRTILTTRGGSPNTHDNQRPIIDGRIWVPDYSRLDYKLREEWIKSNLSWSNDSLPYTQLFLKHLALHITALAAKEEVKEIQWALSYSNGRSKRDQNMYIQTWENICKELEEKTGVKQNSPTINSQYFLTEGLAVTRYFADYEARNLLYSTCISIESQYCNITILERETLLYECSVGLDIYKLFNQLLSPFLRMNPQFEVEITNYSLNQLSRSVYTEKMDHLLENERYNRLQGNREFQKILQIMAIGLSGLYYYIGIILKVLYQEQKRTRSTITPVYVAGIGSTLLNFLDVTGRFSNHSEINSLLSKMLAQGSGFKYTKKINYLSSNPGHEVAYGLALSETNIIGLSTNNPEPPIAGENCEINGISMAAHGRLDLSQFENTVRYKNLELTNLKAFLGDFQQALKDLKITTIKPLAEYEDEQWQTKLWENVQIEIENYCLRIELNDRRTEPPFIIGLRALLEAIIDIYQIPVNLSDL